MTQEQINEEREHYFAQAIANPQYWPISSVTGVKATMSEVVMKFYISPVDGSFMLDASQALIDEIKLMVQQVTK